MSTKDFVLLRMARSLQTACHVSHDAYVLLSIADFHNAARLGRDEVEWHFRIFDANFCIHDFDV